ncbi:MAG TPA: hypothetical protein VE687_14460 [Stellaceae bacterium]|nr:hypothetical protein [Stellaceae bacterium]
MARGFKTGGRQKGTPNKATLWKRARAQEGLRLADERGVTPLDIMLSFMRGEGKYTREEYRAARDAAPLRHQVLAPMRLPPGAIAAQQAAIRRPPQPPNTKPIPASKHRGFAVERVPVSTRALIARINRALPDGQQLKVSCPWSVLGSIVGRYYIVGPDRLVRAHVDLTELAQELGRLASYEELADDRTFDSDSEWEQQVEAAVAAAPFVHPRLAPVSVELTAAELRALRDQ